MTLKIFTDGGSRGNPGPAGAGAVGIWREQEIFAVEEYLGEVTNNVAEYKALILSAEALKEWLKKNPQEKVAKISWFLDSKLVVEQLNHRWKIKQDHLRELAQQAWKKISSLAIPYSINYIPREKNKRADFLVNQAQDKNATGG